MCARHIYGNLRRAYPGKDLPKHLFWAVAKSFNTADYNRAIAALRSFDEGVYEAVMMKNPQNCSRAFFNCTSMCEDVSNNFSESYNNTINKARELPLVAMLETIRRQCLIRNDMRRKKTEKHKGKYSLKVAKTIEEEKTYLKYCQVIPCGNGHYEVDERGHAFRVDMNSKTCAGRRWSLTGIPCRHVLRVIGMKKHLKPEDFVNSDWLLSSTWVAQYSEPLMGVNGMYFWPQSGEERIQPPPRPLISKGPTKKQKRMKGKNESPKKKNKKGKEVEVEEHPQKKMKITREGMTLHCSRCSITGHNTRKCPNVGVLNKRASRYTGEGVSQTSQASQTSLGD